MAYQAEQEGGIRSVVKIQDRLVEKSDFTGLQFTLPDQQTRYYLAAPIYRSSFGIEGYLLVDHHPEQRWHSYTDGNCTGVPYHIGEPSYCDHDVPPTNDPIRLAHFLNTDQGFKLVRFFHLPEAVIKAFAEDKFLGDRLIEKCIQDRTLPEYFDEDPVSIHYLDQEDRQSIGRTLAVINSAYNELAADWVADVPPHRLYFSFHPWPWASLVIKIGEESIAKALVNFDRTLESLNPRVILERRQFVLQDGQSPDRLTLPPAYQ